jgi:hypothetical protein
MRTILAAVLLAGSPAIAQFSQSWTQLYPVRRENCRRRVIRMREL